MQLHVIGFNQMEKKENIKDTEGRKMKYYITAYIGLGTKEDTIKVHYDYNGRKLVRYSLSLNNFETRRNTKGYASIETAERHIRRLMQTDGWVSRFIIATRPTWSLGAEIIRDYIKTDTWEYKENIQDEEPG